MDPDPIVAFYAGGRDDRGRTLDEILGWSDHFLEVTHDFIQWMFPTRTPSAVNPWAPLVTDATASEFRARPELVATLRRAFVRMLTFYGLRLAEGPPDGLRIATDGQRFEGRAADWLRPHDHNHLRLTRIMQSLNELGLPAEAKALQRCLVSDVADGPGRGRITPETLRFWRSAC